MLSSFKLHLFVTFVTGVEKQVRTALFCGTRVAGISCGEERAGLGTVAGI